ncbi:hypothetical protein SUGI_0601760 [Cryptomeria japonica]|nr:hypothetical protein SUGI_0601760 [Cryptomeria japonica]
MISRDESNRNKFGSGQGGAQSVGLRTRVSAKRGEGLRRARKRPSRSGPNRREEALVLGECDLGRDKMEKREKRRPDKRRNLILERIDLCFVISFKT